MTNPVKSAAIEGFGITDPVEAARIAKIMAGPSWMCNNEDAGYHDKCPEQCESCKY